MIIDKSDFWDKHAAVKPYVVTDVDPKPESESKQSVAEFNNFLDSDLCIQCGACHRPYLNRSKNQVTQEFLNLFAFYHNHRVYIESIMMVNERVKLLWRYLPTKIKIKIGLNS